ncbi:MAG: KDO2-lipid IV(A) lauroyltransferase [Roseivirga sp.]
MFFLYYLVLKPLSLLPWPLAYGVSNFLYLLLYKVFRYRVKVVDQNIRNSFPDYTDKEVLDLRRKNLKNFFDVMIEGFKLFSMSNEELHRRMVATNPEIVDKYLQENRSVIITGAHYNNWEFVANGINPWLKHQTCGIYHPFKNKFVERKMLEKRGRTGMLLVSRKQVKEGFFDTYHKPLATFFATDQSPTIAKKVYWTQFLNQETAVAFGAEKFARSQDAAVFYAYNERVKKGHYQMSFKLLCDNPNELPIGAITELHVRELEKVILAEPTFWLWTHKRWKRKRKTEEA